jgi:hypothetical protein
MNPKKAPKGPKPKSSNPGRAIQTGNNAVVAVSKPSRGKQPSMASGKDSVVVKHSELLGNVWGTDLFSINATVPMNPGVGSTFPWLSQIARNFEMYKFRKLRVRYVPRCATTQTGGLYLAVDPKSSDSPPTSEVIMGSYSVMIEDAPWKEMVLDVPSDVLDASKYKYIRTTTLGVNDVASLYDIGRFYVGVVGFGGNFVAGKVFFEYEVELHRPALSPQGNIESGSVDNGGGGATAGIPFGVVPAFFGTLINNVSTTSSQYIALQSMVTGAEYAVCFEIVGTGISALGFALINFTAKTTQACINGAGTLGIFFGTYICNATTPQLTTSITATTVTDANFFITRLDPIPSF